MRFKKVLSNLEIEGQGRGIIMEVTHLLLLGTFYYIALLGYVIIWLTVTLYLGYFVLGCLILYPSLGNLTNNISVTFILFWPFFFKFLGLFGHLFNEIQCNPGAMQTLDRTGNNLLMKHKIPIKMIKCNLIISIIIQAVSKIYYSNLKKQNLFHQSSLLGKLPYMYSI